MKTALGWIYLAALFLFIFAPIAASVVFSFNSDRFPTLPLGQFTTDWYVRAFSRPEVWQAIAATEGSASANITQTIRSFFRIQRSKRQPDSAQVSVQFEGEWFWIDRNDKPSRQVFSLVRDLFDLQVKTVSQQAPILNIPVGR